MAVGGFGTHHWPGEDTKLCLNLIKRSKGKLVYCPEAIVYHHRRSSPQKHIRQVRKYGRHRGHFARIHPQTSLRFRYLLAPLFFIFVLAGPILKMGGFQSLLPLYFVIWFIYGLALVYSATGIFFKIRNWKIAAMSVPYQFATHFVYGLHFVEGFLSKEIKQDLGR